MIVEFPPVAPTIGSGRAANARPRSAWWARRLQVSMLPSQSSPIECLSRGRGALPRVQADRQVGPTTFMRSLDFQLWTRIGAMSHPAGSAGILPASFSTPSRIIRRQAAGAPSPGRPYACTTSRFKGKGVARLLIGLAVLFGCCFQSRAQSPQFTGIERLTNREILLKLSFTAGVHCRIDASTNLPQWTALATLQSTGVNYYVDSAAPYLGQRFFRAASLAGTAPITGDHLATANGDLVIHPIDHASFVMSWNGMTIYNDPVGASTRYAGLPRANLILISHTHPDHFNTTTLNSVTGATCVIIAPQAAANSMGAALRALTTVLTNGASASVGAISIDAVPAYNERHTLGTGNGYVLTVGGKRIYIAGDTGDIPEMRALPDIDVAFVPMNLPYTMSVSSAASAVRAFRPKVVYPYHYSPSTPPSDVNLFKSLVGADLGIEVRLRKWY